MVSVNTWYLLLKSESKVFHVDTSLPAQVLYLLLLLRRRIISASACTLTGHYVLQDTCSQTQRNKWAHALKTPIHLSILGIQFSLSCFSSASPNGWLNQLCSAPFKSSGMPVCCQRLASEPGGNRVAGGEAAHLLLSTSLKSAFIKKQRKGKKQNKDKNSCISLWCASVHLQAWYMDTGAIIPYVKICDTKK